MSINKNIIKLLLQGLKNAKFKTKALIIVYANIKNFQYGTKIVKQNQYNRYTREY